MAIQRVGAGVEALPPWDVRGIYFHVLQSRHYLVESIAGHTRVVPWDMESGERCKRVWTPPLEPGPVVEQMTRVADAPVALPFVSTPPRGCTIEALRNWRDGVAYADNVQNRGRVFLGFPDRWVEAGRFRCTQGHVSGRVLKSEEHGDLCLACRAPCLLTYPEDTERPEAADEHPSGKLSADDGGATTIEYGIVVSLVFLVLVVAVYVLSDRVMVMWGSIAGAMGGAS